MEYVLIIHAAEEGGYWAEVSALEGCFIQGETVEEVREDAPQAIASHVEALREDGQPVPGDNDIVVATVTVPAASKMLPRASKRRSQHLHDDADAGRIWVAESEYKHDGPK